MNDRLISWLAAVATSALVSSEWREFHDAAENDDLTVPQQNQKTSEIAGFCDDLSHFARGKPLSRWCARELDAALSSACLSIGQPLHTPASTFRARKNRRDSTVNHAASSCGLWRFSVSMWVDLPCDARRHTRIFVFRRVRYGAAMSEAKWNRDIFVALAAVGWADGTLDADEADALVRAAVESGLELDEIAEIEKATSTKVDIGVIDRAGMSKEDRLFVYAVARWIAEIDGQVTEEETVALSELGEKLGIPERPRAHAEAAAREVASLPDGDRPSRYDIPKLRVLIGQRLKAAQEPRA